MSTLYERSHNILQSTKVTMAPSIIRAYVHTSLVMHRDPSTFILLKSVTETISN